MKIGKIVRRILITTQFLAVGYLGSALLISHLAERHSPQITSQQQLEEVLEVERKIMNFPTNLVIKGTLNHDEMRSHAKRVEQDFYEFTLGEKYHPTISTLQHELYHIKDGHLESKPKNKILAGLKYLLWFEPKAIFYQFKRSRER